MSPEVSTLPDAAASLGDKLASVELTGAEAAALDSIIRRAHAVLRPHIEPVVDPSVIPATAQRGIIMRTARALRTGVDEARNAFEDALTMLQAQADAPDLDLMPSPKVDEAWHQFVLFTMEYAAYCEELGGFIHHVPSVDEPRPPGEGRRKLSRSETYDHLCERGYRLHAELWRTPTVADAMAYLRRT